MAFHPSGARWRQRFYKSWFTFALQSRNSRIGLARIQEPFDLVVQVYALFQTRGAPYVLYADNTNRLSEEAWPEWKAGGGLLRGMSRDELEQRAYGGAEHVFTMGRPVATSLIEHYGLSPARVTVVGAGANFNRLPEPEPHVRQPVVLFVGREFRRKGGDRLLEAFRHVRARIPGARLQIVGAGEAPAEPGVEALGLIDDRRRLAELYSRASVFCLPSRFEPYGLVVLEAMAYGLPCVVTSVNALPEMVDDGRTGIVVPPDETTALAAALIRLLEEPDLAAGLGTAGRKRVESDFTWDKVVERMAPVLERFAVRGEASPPEATAVGPAGG
jgi:alpha-maltose-1-phosphate synthase